MSIAEEAPALRVSVLMTAYNPHSGRLERTLGGLLGQSLPATQWEFVLADNASAIPLKSADLGLDRFRNWRLVREDRIGTVFGRASAVVNSSAPVIVWVDDDNVLDVNYLENTCRIFDRLPVLGVGGGKSIPDWEGGPPEPWVDGFAGVLALRDLGDEEFRVRESDSLRCPDHRPFGAGMIVRRSAIEAWATEVRSFGSAFGQRGGKLLRGEDDDIVLHCFKQGWEIGYFPELKLTHIIPPERATREYLARLLQGVAQSEVLWRNKYGVGGHTPAALWTIPLRKMRAYLRHRAWAGPAEYLMWKSVCGVFDGRALLNSAPKADDARR